MKRSEMFKKIEEVLAYQLDGICNNELSLNAIANEILCVVEGSMKPPVQKRCPVLLTTVHTWEPENDL